MKIFYQNNLPDLDWKTATKKPLILRVAKVLKNPVFIKTPEGDTWANPNDYIIEDADGNQFVSYSNIFPISYDVLNDCAKFEVHFQLKELNQNQSDENFHFFSAKRKTIEVNFAQVNEDFKIIEKQNVQYGFAGDFIIQTPNTTHFYRIYPSIFFKTYVIN